MNPINQRIKKEFDYLYFNPVTSFGLTVGTINNNDIRNWKFTLIGPNDSLYKGGFFNLIVNFPDNYPNAPPIICFLNPIYHINVNPKLPRFPNDPPLGYIDIYNLGFWEMDSTMAEVITNIYSLFYYINYDVVYGEERLNEYRFQRNIYNEKVKYFTRKYGKCSDNISIFKDRDWNFSLN